MFDQLSERLQSTLSEVRSRGKLSEADVDAAMRDIRLALLEADVNFKVVRSFTSTVKERCLDEGVTQALDPGQQVIKIVNEELASLMGGSGRDLAFASTGPTVILMAGLQGSGKTAACAKLARHLREQHKEVALAACDVYRPAAVEQLVTVGERAGAHVYQQGTERDPVDIAEWAVAQAKADDRDALIIDTAGRLHVDDELMAELARIRKRTKPHDVLLVVDAMTGQDAVGVAEAFAEAAEFDGVVMTKLDGDARGGAALSVKAVTGKPIIFASTGEKLEDFERFHPDRMAGRILGMGDVLSLIEKAEKEVGAEQAVRMQEKMRRAEFTLEDFLGQMRQVRRMGPIGNLVGMLPGMGGMRGLQGADVDERELDRLEAMILSMTREERANPELINGSRRKRIAAGSGVKVQQVNQLVKQFDQTRKLMKRVASGKVPDAQQMLQELGGAPKPRIRRR
jgi:signal recognition particle subunit SRP54